MSTHGLLGGAKYRSKMCDGYSVGLKASLAVKPHARSMGSIPCLTSGLAVEVLPLIPLSYSSYMVVARTLGQSLGRTIATQESKFAQGLQPGTSSAASAQGTAAPVSRRLEKPTLSGKNGQTVYTTRTRVEVLGWGHPDGTQRGGGVLIGRSSMRSCLPRYGAPDHYRDGRVLLVVAWCRFFSLFATGIRHANLCLHQ